jgi:hypothetical protein
MIPENPSPKKFWYADLEGFEFRSQQRLKEDLGIDEDSAELILHLRNQVIALQSRLHELEAELATYKTNQHMRLACYREVFYEGTWIELDYPD